MLSDIKPPSRTSFVTGASRGIGRAIAERLVCDGCAVFLHYHDYYADEDQAAAETAEAIKEAGGRVYILKGDMRSIDAVRAMFAQMDSIITHDGLPPLSVMVNNAGVYPYADLMTTDEVMFDDVFNLNVKGLFFATQEASKRMFEGSSIINISTILTSTSLPQFTLYNATKGAVDTLTRDIAITLGPRNITVNAVNPGFIRTDGTRDVIENEEAAAAFVAETPLGRIGTPQDVAGVVAFLASDDARWITGQTLVVAGGWRL